MPLIICPFSPHGAVFKSSLSHQQRAPVCFNVQRAIELYHSAVSVDDRWGGECVSDVPTSLWRSVCLVPPPAFLWPAASAWNRYRSDAPRLTALAWGSGFHWAPIIGVLPLAPMPLCPGRCDFFVILKYYNADVDFLWRSSLFKSRVFKYVQKFI